MKKRTKLVRELNQIERPSFIGEWRDGAMLLTHTPERPLRHGGAVILSIARGEKVVECKSGHTNSKELHALHAYVQLVERTLTEFQPVPYHIYIGDRFGADAQVLPPEVVIRNRQGPIGASVTLDLEGVKIFRAWLEGVFEDLEEEVDVEP